MEITVILPVHNERDNLSPLMLQLQAALDPLRRSYEVIAIDDGSDDGSGDALADLCTEFDFLKVIVFRKNYGQSAAFDAGFRHASGRIVVTMDADLQNDPADIPKMLATLEEQRLDFVAGWREQRRDGFLLRTLPSRIANSLIRRVTKTRLRDLGCSLKVYRRELTDELRLYGEMHRFIGVLIEDLGARTGEVSVNHRPRSRGHSKYGITRTFKVMLDLLTVWFMRGYQTKPIYVFGGAGLLCGSLGVLLSAVVLFEKIFHHIWVHRNPLFILSMIFSVVAVQFLGMGLIAEIMVRTYFESQHKPSYHVSEKLGFDRSAQATEQSTLRPVLTFITPGANPIHEISTRQIQPG